MPTYTYRCSEGHEFEVVEKITDLPRLTCTCQTSEGAVQGGDNKCKGQVERIITKTSFVLKGNGWAKDGYVKKV